MTPLWWVTYLILALYMINAVWLTALGRPVAGLYWLFAAGITICAMREALK
jgi:hypothetical protein